MNIQHSVESVISKKIAKALLQDNDKILIPLTPLSPSSKRTKENIIFLKEDGVYTYAFYKTSNGYKRIWYPELMMSPYVVVDKDGNYSINGTTIKFNEEYYLENPEYRVQ